MGYISHEPYADSRTGDVLSAWVDFAGGLVASAGGLVFSAGTVAIVNRDIRRRGGRFRAALFTRDSRLIQSSLNGRLIFIVGSVDVELWSTLWHRGNLLLVVWYVEFINCILLAAQESVTIPAWSRRDGDQDHQGEDDDNLIYSEEPKKKLNNLKLDVKMGKCFTFISSVLAVTDDCWWSNGGSQLRSVSSAGLTCKHLTTPCSLLSSLCLNLLPLWLPIMVRIGLDDLIWRQANRIN